MHLHFCGNLLHDVPMLILFAMHQPEMALPALRKLGEVLRSRGVRLTG